MNAIEITGVKKSYPGFTLGSLNLTLPQGSIMGLIGENGAGKSTLIKLILNVVRKDEGEILLFGKENQKYIAQLKEEVGVVLDEVGLPGCLTPAEVGRVMAHTFKNWDKQLYQSYLDGLSLPENKPFQDFSRGMKMKLGIATALSHHPKLLLLDEATSGLDPVVRDEITDLFSEFTRTEEHAVLISSHIVSDLEKLCDYVSFIHKGQLILCEEKDRLKERYGIIHCSAEALAALPPESVIGKKENAYGVEAVIAREAAPRELSVGGVNLEELFIYMMKGAVKR